ncbi:MAG: putative secreted protein [Polyangiaceae bacterium]|jgi:hypothetical protein|nr:putative secreted protein [Polyangiaceae bacterium]
MRLHRLLVALLCLATLGLTAAPAAAQTVGTGTLTVSNILWKDRPNQNLMSNQLNRADCLADVKATVTAAVRNVPASGNTFEIWSGTGCDQQANRAPTSVSRTCSKVKSVGNPVDQTIEIAYRDLIKPYGDDSPATAAVCDQNVATGLITRTLYYIIINSSFNSVIATTPSWSFKYDIKGPPPPTAVKGSPGDESIVTSFTPPPSEPNLLKYRFYCSPKGASPVAAGGTASTGGTNGADTGGTDTGGTDTAGTDTGGTDTGGTDTGGTDTGGTDTGGTDTGGTDTGGTDTGSVGGTTGGLGAGTSGTSGTTSTAGTAGTGVVIDPNCQSSSLIPGQDVPADAVQCGEVVATGASGGETTPDLTNGEEYVVAVAAEDTVFNVGKLSNLACATPKDVRGFFESYRDAGGEAGGGYCSFAPARRSGTAFLLALGAAALVMRRRRK